MSDEHREASGGAAASGSGHLRDNPIQTRRQRRCSRSVGQKATRMFPRHETASTAGCARYGANILGFENISQLPQE